MINLGNLDAQETSLAAFFGTFQMRMSKISRIPKSVTERYSRNINFLVSIDLCHMEAVESRLVWIFELDYEVLEDEIDHYARILLEIPKNPKCRRYLQ